MRAQRALGQLYNGRLAQAPLNMFMLALSSQRRRGDHREAQPQDLKGLEVEVTRIAII